MADDRLERELSLARKAAPVFALGRQQQVIWGVRRRLKREPKGARGFVIALAAACVVASVAYVSSRPRTDEAVLHGSKDERWELRDGSRILLETSETRVTKRRESTAEVAFELTAGAARFDIAHRPERRFRVQAGPVDVEVIGTRFRVEREGQRTRVAVERGRVLVSWARGSAVLSAGEGGVYPPAETVTVTTPEAAPSAEPVASEPRAAAPAPAATTDLTPRTASAEELFATADLARANGHAKEAVRALRELTQRFPRDGRSPLAAFTRGRLLLENLGQAREAARAFAQARALAGGSSALAEDALAREAEAWRSAGIPTEATRCAKLYRTLYPRGAHLKEVLHAGGLTPVP